MNLRVLDAPRTVRTSSPTFADSNSQLLDSSSSEPAAIEGTRRVPTRAERSSSLDRFKAELGMDQRLRALRMLPVGQRYDEATEAYLKQLESSPTAKADIDFLRANGVNIELTEGGGSRFDKTKGANGTVVIDVTRPSAVGDLANEAQHARRSLSGTSTINTERARTLGREEYVARAVAEEADSEIHQRTVERELAGQPPLSEAEKEEIRSAYADGRARAGVEVDGEHLSYADYHGASWDRVQSDPNAEAAPPAGVWDWAKNAAGAVWDGVQEVGGAIVNGAEAIARLAGDALEFGKGVVDGVKQQGLDLWNDAKKLGQLGTDVAKAVARGDMEGAVAPFKQAFEDAVEDIKNLGPDAVKAFEDLKNTLLNGSAFDRGVLLGNMLGLGAKAGTGAAALAKGLLSFIKRRANIPEDKKPDGTKPEDPKLDPNSTEARRANPIQTGNGHTPGDPISQDFSTAREHVTEPGTIGSRDRGINGGHRPADFDAAISGQGEVTRRREVPGFPGIEVVDYQLYKMTPQGVVETELKAKKFEKTLLDPAKWSDEQVEKLLKDVFGDATGNGPVRRDVNGVTFVGWIRDGKLQSFGIELPAS